jgi:hypothetical protein
VIIQYYKRDSNQNPNTQLSRAHTDQNESPWNFGFTFAREAEEEPEDRMMTRGFVNKFLVRPHGLDYVDFETKTIVRAAPNTMTGFQPKYMHGTTNGHRVRQFGAALPVSSHIVKALQESLTNKQELEKPLMRVHTANEQGKSDDYLEPPYYCSDEAM